MLAHKLNIVVPSDHSVTVRIPDDVPAGPAELILLAPGSSSAADDQAAELRPYGLCAGEFTVPEDFDDPLPADVLRDFEGG